MRNRQITGIILAAGRGSRMSSVSLPFSKTLIEIANLPVISYAVRSVISYVDNIVLVTNPLTSEKILETVERNMCSKTKPIIIAEQKTPLGVADALASGLRSLKSDSQIVVICGDNIILDNKNIGKALENIGKVKQDNTKIILIWTYLKFDKSKAKKFAVWKPDDKNGRLIEKPENPPTDICWCGPLVFYSSKDVLRRISKLKLSARGEYEMTDLMNSYITEGKARKYKLSGFWFDVGDIDSLKEAERTLTGENL